VTAAILTFPSTLSGLDFVTTEKRTIAGRIDEVIELARNPGPLTQFAVLTVLEAVCDESLRGSDLWLAWLAAHEALEILRESDPDHWDFETWRNQADTAVLALVHGSNYHGGRAA
jgi:hypothetical protein